MTEQLTDPRPYYDRSLRWVRDLATDVRPDQLDDPTPCPEFDVRALLGHLLATVHRATGIGAGADPTTMPVVVTEVPDDGWAAALAAAEDGYRAAWRDERRLDAEVRVPWGLVSGRAALWGYVNEALVHGWDLAVATGQPAEADADLAEAALAGVLPKLPADRRGGPVPFAEVVPSDPGAGATERLANWSGHSAGPVSASR
jgi:uncharacterized protein (TIGR03086 family)